jgi:plastocyanin
LGDRRRRRGRRDLIASGRLLAIAGVALLALAGCGDSAEETGSGDVAVAIKTFQFSPNPLEVAAGTTVTWTNQDDIDHTVTAGTPERPEGLFDGSLDGEGATFNFTFDDPGTYPYFCSIHPSMLGQVRVS